eukprot:TRINITY_DN15247_c0_g1_i1.p1 TRINITY_DN15247_c0_g1~~TRINITY_DN15247_c0_g1_i1.p1  ORF type:complete len:108 (-),score=25.87 TRINITY_DN15247_c0_g1_i1:84-383(-)
MSGLSQQVYQSIQQKLRAALSPETLTIIDESAKHAGHAAMKGLPAVESHFRVEVVSAAFLGKDLASRHRLVYSILEAEMKTIHALSLRTKTPEEQAKLK